ncbi:MAG TPA: cyclic nucleotide-binding domain-containing protein [Acidimicrobiales bacterium]|jgi:CRP-like cAMP-binding protein|nr:cyclic nucleotide-binding domain-containing protein [Acidimicrobiales bacterium]
MLTHRRREVDDLCTQLDVPAGRVLCRQGELVRQVIVLLGGEVEVRVDTHPIGTLHAGDHIGFAEVGTLRPAPATVTTTSPARVLVYTPSEWRAISSTRPQSSAVGASIV